MARQPHRKSSMTFAVIVDATSDGGWWKTDVDGSPYLVDDDDPAQASSVAFAPEHVVADMQQRLRLGGRDVPWSVQLILMTDVPGRA